MPHEVCPTASSETPKNTLFAMLAQSTRQAILSVMSCSARQRTSAPVSTAAESSRSSSGDFGPFIFLNVSLALRVQSRISSQTEQCSAVPERHLPMHDLALPTALSDAGRLRRCRDDWGSRELMSAQAGAPAEHVAPSGLGPRDALLHVGLELLACLGHHIGRHLLRG